jgi:hypothetical protein
MSSSDSCTVTTVLNIRFGMGRRNQLYILPLAYNWTHFTVAVVSLLGATKVVGKPLSPHGIVVYN